MRILYAKIDQFCENILTNSNYTLIIKVPSKTLKKKCRVGMVKSRFQKLFSLLVALLLLFSVCVPATAPATSFGYKWPTSAAPFTFYCSTDGRGVVRKVLKAYDYNSYILMYP